MSAEKMAKYLIQFEWADPWKPSNSTLNKWRDWKVVEKESDEKAFAEAESEFGEKRNWASRESLLGLLDFRVCRILEKEDCVKK